MNKESKGRVDYYDSLRVAAMVAVVMIHVATPVIKMGYKIGGMSADWWTGDVYTAMTRFAVLVFLMISGAAMLGQRYGYRDFARRRMVRIFVPFACFTVLYLAFKLKMDRPAVHVGSLRELWRWIGDKYIECGVSQHFR